MTIFPKSLFCPIAPQRVSCTGEGGGSNAEASRPQCSGRTSMFVTVWRGGLSRGWTDRRHIVGPTLNAFLFTQGQLCCKLVQKMWNIFTRLEFIFTPSLAVISHYRPEARVTLRWKWSRMIISPSHGWKKACLMLLYRMSTLSPRTEVYRNPASNNRKFVIEMTETARLLFAVNLVNVASRE